MLAPAAHAVTVDFSGLVPVNASQALAQSETIAPITATAWVYSGGAYSTNYDNGLANPTPVTLWGRDQNNDHGLGVCSETNCATGGGDVNELDNSGAFEVIRLDAGGLDWTDLWVSSLDGGGTNNNESGLVYFSDNAFAALDATTSSFAVDFNDLSPSVEGSIWSILQAAGLTAADAQKQYVFFTADGSNGTNNDYLVWKATVVPIPAAAWLFGSALLGVFGVARRRQSQMKA